MSDELLGIFVAEARELMQAATEDLLALEHAPGDSARLDGAFRALHTMKGSVGLFDLAPLGAVLHAAEDLLGAFRDRRLHPDPGATAVLLECVEAIDGWIDGIAQTGRLPAEAEDRCRRLAQAIGSRLAGSGQPQAASAEVAQAAPDWLPALLARDPAAVDAAASAGERLTALRYVPGGDTYFRGGDPLLVLRGIPGLRIVDIALREPGTASRTDPFACNLVICCASAASAEALRKATRFVADECTIVPVPARAVAPADTARPVSRSLRVEAERVEALADLVGELVVAKNRLAHLAASAALPPDTLKRFAESQAEIDRLAAGLQRGVMRLRMVRLDETFRRLPRVVRETASRLGKTVRLEIEGGGAETDKTVADALYEPLLHIVRNAIDHGIEDAAGRAACGKSEAGTIRVTARRDGHQIAIAIADDGRGIDPAAVRRRALERGMAADGLDNAGILDLIFAPGFSTAGRVTETSGRGVGLDVVRRGIEAIGGRVGIDSTPGRGTSMQIVLPLAVAVTRIVIVQAGGDRYGVPFDDVAESIRLGSAAIQPVQDGFAFILRARTVPLVSLADLLGTAGRQRSGDAKILVTGASGEMIGVEVDGFGERMDVVLRPVTGLLAGTRGALGTALLGDGRVLIVLNLADLIHIRMAPRDGVHTGEFVSA